MKAEDKLRLGEKLRKEAFFDFKKEEYCIEITKAYSVIDSFVLLGEGVK